MKVVAIYGSARKKGFSSLAVDAAVACCEERGAEVKRYHLVDMNIEQCRGCFACRRKEACVLKDDMTQLFQDIVESDFVIFSSPVYCFDISATFKLMFERLYPMLGGGMALGEGFQKYVMRYPKKKCMLILAQGVPGIMCREVRKRTQSNLKMNGFDNMGTISVCSTYSRKKPELTMRELAKIRRVCGKALG